MDRLSLDRLWSCCWRGLQISVMNVIGCYVWTILLYELPVQFPESRFRRINSKSNNANLCWGLLQAKTSIKKDLSLTCLSSNLLQDSSACWWLRGRTTFMVFENTTYSLQPRQTSNKNEVSSLLLLLFLSFLRSFQKYFIHIYFLTFLYATWNAQNCSNPAMRELIASEARHVWWPNKI